MRFTADLVMANIDYSSNMLTTEGMCYLSDDSYATLQSVRNSLIHFLSDKNVFDDDRDSLDNLNTIMISILKIAYSQAISYQFDMEEVVRELFHSNVIGNDVSSGMTDEEFINEVVEGSINNMDDYISYVYERHSEDVIDTIGSLSEDIEDVDSIFDEFHEWFYEAVDFMIPAASELIDSIIEQPPCYLYTVDEDTVIVPVEYDITNLDYREGIIYYRVFNPHILEG